MDDTSDHIISWSLPQNSPQLHIHSPNHKKRKKRKAYRITLLTKLYVYYVLTIKPLKVDLIHFGLQ